MRDDVKEYIVCAAILVKDGKHHVHQPFNVDEGFVVCGLRHHNCFYTISLMAPERFSARHHIEGFLTSRNRFVGRAEAQEIAVIQNQTISNHKELFSEDIY